jgi:siroheme synthase-like protein
MTFPLVLELSDRLCLVVGASSEARHRVERFVSAGARVRWVVASGGQAGDEPPRSAAVERVERAWLPTDLDDCWLVVFADTDPATAAALRAACDERRLFFCAIDQTRWNSFNHVAIVQQGPVQIAISTAGKAPALARKLRQSLEAMLGDGRLGRFAQRLVRLREQAAPGKKAEVMAEALVGFELRGQLHLPPERDEE